MTTSISETPWLRQMQSSIDDVYGNHPGHFAALNVRNPEPGMVYYWARKKPAQVQRLKTLGYCLVDPSQGDREKLGADIPESLSDAVGGVPYDDVILMKIPVEQYAELKERQRADAEAALHSSDEAFLSRGLEIGEQLRTANPRGVPVYYQDPSHGIKREGPDGAPR